MKFCSRCKKDLELSEFSKQAKICKPCNKEYQKERRQKLKASPKLIVESKRCSTCKTIQDAIYFNKYVGTKDGLGSQCKNCLKEYRERTKVHNKEYSKKYYNDLLADKNRVIVESKICSICKIEKPASEFWKSIHNPCGLYSSCISCKSVREKESDRMTVRLKNGREWRRNNLEKARKYCNNWEKEKRKTDLSFKLRRSVKCAIINSMRGRTPHTKYFTKIIFEHLHYTVEEFRKHIELLWEPWMNWSNHGKYDPNKKTWQIDHIIPQSKLPFVSLTDDNFIKCWKLDNLRPLETIANIKKGNRV